MVIPPGFEDNVLIGYRLVMLASLWIIARAVGRVTSLDRGTAPPRPWSAFGACPSCHRGLLRTLPASALLRAWSRAQRGQPLRCAGCDARVALSVRPEAAAYLVGAVLVAAALAPLVRHVHFSAWWIVGFLLFMAVHSVRVTTVEPDAVGERPGDRAPGRTGGGVA